MSYVHDGFVDSTDVLLGEDCHQQPDWFKVRAATLRPLIASCNAHFN